MAVSHSYKKLSYRTETAERTMLVNSCYVLRGMGARKVQRAKVAFKVIGNGAIQ